MIETALHYAAKGWQVFPLLPNDKRPATENGFKAATTQREIIEGWWLRWPDANVGIVTGTVSGIVVLDVDRKHGVDGVVAATELDLPETLVVKTPSGGYHLFFTLPEGVTVPRRIGVRPGLDILGDAGYVVAAGSTVNGSTYEIVRNRPMVPCPDVLVKLAAHHKAAKVVPIAGKVKAGGRNDYLTTLAGKLRRMGGDETEVVAALMAVNEQRNDPPLPEAEVRRTAMSIARYEPAPLDLDLDAPLEVARRFVATCYGHPDGRTLQHWQDDFYAWRGSHYARLDGETLRADLYNFLERATKPNRRLVDNVLDALRAAAHLEARPPEWLDGRSASELVPCANGLVEIASRRLLPATPVYFNLHAAPFGFDPAAPSPGAWLEFLHSLWPDDPEAIASLQEVCGLLLTTDTTFQKILLFIGPKRGGKGTIARVLRGLLGPENVTSPTLAALGQNFGLAGLIGKPLAIISDARLSGRSDLAAVTENLLRISGEDAVSVPRKFQSDWDGQLPVRFLLLSNELPALTDASGALASRFLIFTLKESFFGREDRTLTGRLLTELPSVFTWALDGLQRLRARGFLIQPASGTAAVEMLDRLASPIRTFVADDCALDPAAEIPCAALFDAWADWCETQHRDHPGTLQMFGRNLTAAFPGIATRRPRTAGDTRQRVYGGIRLRRSDDLPAGSAPGPRWSADLTIAHTTPPIGIEIRNRPDRGPSRTTPDGADLVEVVL